MGMEYVSCEVVTEFHTLRFKFMLQSSKRTAFSLSLLC